MIPEAKTQHKKVVARLQEKNKIKDIEIERLRHQILELQELIKKTEADNNKAVFLSATK
jgi:hypothetical protein